MFRHYKKLLKNSLLKKNKVIKSQILALGVLVCSAFFGYSIIANQLKQVRRLAAANDYTQADFERATLSVSTNEFLDSKPSQGRSYFDHVFSLNGQYVVPFPFNKIIDRISEYTGQPMNQTDGSGVKVTIFPMGRSLQRNAAIAGTQQAFSFDPFFRFPRIVIGVDEESKPAQSLLLNLKNKLYIGYNERAEILEAISYNQDLGRYEYQIIRNYAAGKTPEVVYANRSVCLSCHQNQTPIFSRGPWSESNANPFVADKLKQTFDKAFGVAHCQPGQAQAYCYKNNEAYYYGAPVRIDQTITNRFDISTDQGNLIHAYQRIWKDLCSTFECRVNLLQAIWQYRMNSMSGIIPDAVMLSYLQNIEQQWKNTYPNGLSIPSPNIPNRDPFSQLVAQNISNAGQILQNNQVANNNQKTFQDLLSLSKIPTEFEPLLPRLPIDIWKSSGLDGTMVNTLVKGLANEFSFADIKIIEAWLFSQRTTKQQILNLAADCQIDADSKNYAISCSSTGAEGFTFNAYLSPDNKGIYRGTVNDFVVNSSLLKCQSNISQTEKNIFSGLSCPAFSELDVVATKNSDQSWVFKLYKKDGLSLKSFQGYEMSEVNLSFQKSSQYKGRLDIYDQTSFLKDFLKNNQADLFKTAVFNRFQIMKTFTSAAKINLVKNHLEPSSQLPLKSDDESVDSKIEATMTGFTLMKKVCAQCHQNNEGVPPHFMGTVSQPSSDKDVCRFIEQCAARMIYRLKMRQCEISTRDKKKNPMPPELFFKKNPQLVSEWMSQYNPKIISYLQTLVDEKNLSQYLASHGLANASAAASDLLKNSCPESNSVIYDQFPKCEFNQLTTNTLCR